MTAPDALPLSAAELKEMKQAVADFREGDPTNHRFYKKDATVGPYSPEELKKEIQLGGEAHYPPESWPARMLATITQAQTERDTARIARNKALEHAAGVCDDQAHALERNGYSIEMQWTVIGCAKQIRAAKDAT